MQILKHFASTTVLLGLAAGVGTSEARDRPGTPTDPRVDLVGPGEVAISFRNTAGSESVTFEIEITIDGRRMDPNIERTISQAFPSMYGNGVLSERVSREMLEPWGLGPGMNFCFRVWSRTDVYAESWLTSDDRVRSDVPSAWACATLRPDRPPQPESVKVDFRSPASVTDRAVVVSWVIPEFPFGTMIDRMVIERFRVDGNSSAVERTATVVDRKVHGPSYGALDLERVLPPPKQDGRYVYKVCTENVAGRECDSSSLLVHTPRIQGTAQSPALAAAVPAGTSTAATPQELNNPNTARAREIAVSPASQPAPRVNPAVPLGEGVSLNPQPLPPKTTVLKPHGTTVLPSASTQATSAGNSSVNPQGQIQGAASRLPAGAVAAAGTADAQAGELICRGGETPAVARYGTAADGTEIQMMYFSPSEDAARADGSGLVPGKCSFVDRSIAEAGAGIVLFKSTAAGGEALDKSLRDAGNYWRFVVRKNDSGFYEATEHAAWLPIAGTASTLPNRTDALNAVSTATQPGGSAGAAAVATGVPLNLFDLDDRAIIIVGGKKLPAGEAKRVIRKDLAQNSGPSPPPLVLRKPKHTTGTLLANEAPISNPATNVAQAMTTATPGTKASAAGSVLVGKAITPVDTRGSDLSMDCGRFGPMLNNTGGRLTPGETLTLHGSCFGTRRGTVEMHGHFGSPGASVRLSVMRWNENAIDVRATHMEGVHDQKVTVAVVRADGERSLDREVTFTALRDRVAVPAERWSPGATFERSAVFDATAVNINVGSGATIGSDRLPASGPVTFDAGVRITPGCALDEVGVIPRIGTLQSVDGWDVAGPAHEGAVRVQAMPVCKTRIYKHDMAFIVAGSGKKACSVALDVRAWAFCPRGIAP